MPELSVVLCGCGGISRAWLEAVQKVGGIKVLGLVDLRLEAAQKRAQEFGLSGAATGTDLAAMIDSQKPMAVFDCTVPEAHAGVTLAALSRGCAVLGEKPMADSMDNARRMVEASRKAGKIYAVTQTRRYEPGIRKARALLDSGVLGRVHSVHSDFFIGAHFGGFRDQMKHVLLLDMAIHTFDAARMLSRADPLSVLAMDWNPEGSWYADGASAMALFEMSGSLTYSYRGSWCADGLPTPWESSWRIIGTKGTLLWDGSRGFKAEVIAETGGFNSKVKALEIPEVPSTDEFQGHAGVIREFRDAVLTGKTPETHCVDNIKSLAMVLSAIEAAETRAAVRIRY